MPLKKEIVDEVVKAPFFPVEDGRILDTTQHPGLRHFEEFKPTEDCAFFSGEHDPEYRTQAGIIRTPTHMRGHDDEFLRVQLPKIEGDVRNHFTAQLLKRVYEETGLNPGMPEHSAAVSQYRYDVHAVVKDCIGRAVGEYDKVTPNKADADTKQRIGRIVGTRIAKKLTAAIAKNIRELEQERLAGAGEGAGWAAGTPGGASSPEAVDASRPTGSRTPD